MAFVQRISFTIYIVEDERYYHQIIFNALYYFYAAVGLCVCFEVWGDGFFVADWGPRYLPLVKGVNLHISLWWLVTWWTSLLAI